MQEIDLRGSTAAAPAAVWRLLADSSSWPAWTSLDTYEQVQPAGPDGLGEVRLFRTGRHAVREQVVERRPERRLVYTMLSGLPLRDYRAEIELSGRPDGGTDVRWHTTFSPKVPGTGWLYRRALHAATRSFVDGLVRHALDSAG